MVRLEAECNISRRENDSLKVDLERVRESERTARMELAEATASMGTQQQSEIVA